MAFTEFFVIAIMVIILVGYIKEQFGEVEIVKSNIDGRKYIVRKLPDKQAAADLLASLNEDLQLLVHHMMAKYPKDEAVFFLQENYNPDALSEGGTEVGYTSYSVNKGEKIVMCIRQANGDFVDKNVLMYVAIHELAHLMTKEIGHPDSFWYNFKRLTKQAINLGVYTKVDFSTTPQPYCGIDITSSVV